MNVPYCTHSCSYTDTAVPLYTVSDLRKLIADVADEMPVYLFGVAGYDTVYNAEAEIKTQQCIEHSGKIHEVTGLVIQVEG